MDHVPASEWKHSTTTCVLSHGDEVGVDLFDDEVEGQVSIYLRFANGKRFPARTVEMSEVEHARRVLGGWAKRGPVNDYRTWSKEIWTPEPSADCVIAHGPTLQMDCGSNVQNIRNVILFHKEDDTYSTAFQHVANDEAETHQSFSDVMKHESFKEALTKFAADAITLAEMCYFHCATGAA